MEHVFVAADNITSPLGATTAQNYAAVSRGVSGIKPLQLPGTEAVLPIGAILPEQWAAFTAGLHVQDYTKFEQLVIASISEALAHTSIRLSQPRTLLLLSTTKGNIDWLELHEGQAPDGPALQRMQLYHTAAAIGAYFQAAHPPMVVSNACISGLLAILTARRLMAAGLYDQVVIAGADIVTRFVVSGFTSFHALSDQVC
ncbi:MAG TPA: beta-ketoacyl synthase N-terminal-like domain-containing protein, partial [Chitinophaga sp.]